MSGDDKFMTRWVVKHGWKMRMQLSPECTLATTFKADGKFFKQILRWTRNTWRSDFKSLVLERVIWYRYPVQVRRHVLLCCLRCAQRTRFCRLCQCSLLLQLALTMNGVKRKFGFWQAPLAEALSIACCLQL